MSQDITCIHVECHVHRSRQRDRREARRFGGVSSDLPPTQKSPHFNLPRYLPQALLFFLSSFYSSPLRESLRVLLSFISFPSILSYSLSTTTHLHHGCSLRNLARYVNQLLTRPFFGLPLTDIFFLFPLSSLRRLQVLRSPIPATASVAYLV